MAGGMNSKARRVRPTDPSVRPWEHEHPKDAHVLVETEGEWVQGFLLAMHKQPSEWVCWVVWRENYNLREEWVSQQRVKPRP